MLIKDSIILYDDDQSYRPIRSIGFHQVCLMSSEITSEFTLTRRGCHINEPDEQGAETTEWKIGLVDPIY